MSSILDFLSRRSYGELLGMWIVFVSAAFVIAAALVRLCLRLFGRRPRSYWRVVAWAVLALAPIHAFVIVPFCMAVWATSWAQTREDERFYAGPQIDADGTWHIQERRARSSAPAQPEDLPTEAATTSRYEVRFESSDGVHLRGFFVPARTAPRFVVVLTHGLWRGALEIEPVGSMFRDLGGDVLLLELRNHGRSEHRRFTAGLTESYDVLAGVDFVRARLDDARLPLILFGVSLGSAATALAAPKVLELAGLVLDAPLDSVGAVADRMIIGAGGKGRARRFFPEWAWPLQRRALGIRIGADLDSISPVEALRSLATSVHVLVIGGDLDERCPPDAVTRVFDAIPTPAAAKTLWIQAGSGHGKAWHDVPDAYREHLRALVDAIAPPADGSHP